MKIEMQLMSCVESARNDLTSHLDVTHSQLNGLRDVLVSSPQINIDPNLMLEVRIPLVSTCLIYLSVYIIYFVELTVCLMAA